MGQSAAFASILKQRRRALDLTQPELARRLASTLDLPAEEREQFVRLARSGAAYAAGSPDPSDACAEVPSVWALPAPLTPLVGRAREVAAVCEVLAQPAVRVAREQELI